MLRAPLGLNLFDEDLSPEQHQEHFGLFDPSGAIVACVIAVRVSPDKAKIRQMAVHSGHQRRGHGQRIMRLVEQHLAKAGVRRTVLHARETAIGFYESLGYQKVGEPFTEIGIPHLAMEKHLDEVPTDL